MKIILRHASTSLHALFVAQGMENAGSAVFSVTHDGEGYAEGLTSRPEQQPGSRFIVWAKFTDPVTCDSIDAEIVAEFDRH